MGRQVALRVIAALAVAQLASGCSPGTVETKSKAVKTALAGVATRDGFLRVAQDQGFDCGPPTAGEIACWWEAPSEESMVPAGSLAPGIRVSGTFVDGMKSGEYEVTEFYAGQ
jgi:hypothetical protein